MPLITDPTSRLLAVRLRTYRTNIMGYTLVDVANLLPDTCKLSAPLIGRIENCTRAASVPEINALAGALGCTIDWLMRAGELCPTCGQETTV
jgi:hypothetical protein